MNFIPKEFLWRTYDLTSDIRQDRILIDSALQAKPYFRTNIIKSAPDGYRGLIKMIYRSLGVLFSKSGLSIVQVEFHENAGKWTYEVKANSSYPEGNIHSLVRQFMDENNLDYHVALITLQSEVADETFNGALIAAETGLPVITDLSSIDIVLGGNGDFYPMMMQKLGINVGDNTELDKTICVAFMGVLRWREEYNFLSSVTGAKRSSIGGAIWLGQEA